MIGSMRLVNGLNRKLIMAAQLCTIFLTRLVVTMRYQTQPVRFMDTVRPDTRYVIAANHRHFLDPFVAISLMPIRQAVRLLPLKFITANVYYYRFYRPVAWLLGCFPAQQHGASKRYGINESVRSLQSGYNLFIFPEGRRVRGEAVAAKKGISIILDQFPRAELLLAHIIWNLEGYPKELGLRLRPAGKRLHKADPQEIMHRVYEL